MNGLKLLDYEKEEVEKSGELIVIAPPKSAKFSLKVLFAKIIGNLGLDI